MNHFFFLSFFPFDRPQEVSARSVLLSGVRNHFAFVGFGSPLCPGIGTSWKSIALLPLVGKSWRCQQQHQSFRIVRHVCSGCHFPSPETRARHSLGGKKNLNHFEFDLFRHLIFLLEFCNNRHSIASESIEPIESEPKLVSVGLTNVTHLKTVTVCRLPAVPVHLVPSVAKECTDRLRSWISMSSNVSEE